MKAGHEPGSAKRFCRQQWKLQQTFQTPLKELPQFVAAILDTIDDLESGELVIHQVVFEPKKLKALLPGSVLQDEVIITAENALELAPLLACALGDWVDFSFVPRPKRFAIFADHDEYCTFYSNRSFNLKTLADALVSAGFRKVEHWRRSLGAK